MRNDALNKIDSVTSNDSFTDVDITVTYDELGNLSTYSNSMTHSGVGDVDTSINDVPSASRAVLESAYNEIVTLLKELGVYENYKSQLREHAFNAMKLDVN